MHRPPDFKEGSDYHRCETCGQVVDWEDIRQVMWHQFQEDHEPLELDS